jgi:hypothetical protein
VKRIFLFICLVSFLHTSAQTPDPLNFMGDTLRYGILFNGNFDAGSGPMDNAFLSAYYLGKFIDKGMKDRVKGRLLTNNTFGADLEESVYFYQRADSTFSRGKLDVFVGIKNKAHLDGLFTDDLFKVYFYGNKEYENKSIKIAKSNFTFFEYQELQAGFRKKFGNKDKQLILTLGISAISGQNYYGFVNHSSELFTATDGEYLDVKTKAEFRRSSTKNTSFGAANGVGSALALKMEYRKGNNHFICSVSDLGFINWNARSTVLVSDTTFKFRGVYLKNIFDTLEVNFSDTGFVKSLYNKSEKKSFRTILPAWFQLEWNSKYLDNRLLIDISGKYRLLSNYSPQIRVGAGWRFSPLLTAGISMQYGGYTSFGAGVHLRSEMGRGFILSAGSNYVDGLLLTEKRSGQNLYFSLMKLIK